MPGPATYDAAAAELFSRARYYESSAYHLSCWSGASGNSAASGSGNAGPFLVPVEESIDRSIRAFAASAEELRRLARMCSRRADLVREHLQAVRWWNYVVAHTADGEIPPPAPLWPYPWSWQ